MFYKIDEYKAKSLVKEYLIELGYSTNLKIIRNNLDNGNFEYYVHDLLTYRNKKTKTITVINCSEFIKIIKIKTCFSNNCRINPVVKNDKIFYNITYNDEFKMLRKSR